MDVPAPAPLPVTRPYLPPLQEYVALLEGIWERRVLTNQGPLACRLEAELERVLEPGSRPLLVANGALGLQVLLRALGVRGEVVTTPFSYVATTSCPLWEGLSVRFADVEEGHLTLDPAAVEAAITPRTEAILATHVYGFPCDTEGLERVARRHGLAVVYDAAHAFGVRYRGRSLLAEGDASMVSFHATKLFHTVEGGMVVARDPAVAARAEWMRRFGHDGPEAYHGVGMNAKLSELHAAMGLAVLPHLGEIAAARAAVVAAYDAALAGAGDAVVPIRSRPGATANHAYYPVMFRDEALLLRAFRSWADAGVMPRRYFHPSLDTVASLGVHPGEVPVSRRAAGRVACLPLSASMTAEDVARVLGPLARVAGREGGA